MALEGDITNLSIPLIYFRFDEHNFRSTGLHDIYLSKAPEALLNNSN